MLLTKYSNNWKPLYLLTYYGDPNNSRVRNNSREWQNIHILITVGCGIMVGCGKKLPKKNKKQWTILENQ